MTEPIQKRPGPLPTWNAALGVPDVPKSGKQDAEVRLVLQPDHQVAVVDTHQARVTPPAPDFVVDSSDRQRYLSRPGMAIQQALFGTFVGSMIAGVGLGVSALAISFSGNDPEKPLPQPLFNHIALGIAVGIGAAGSAVAVVGEILNHRIRSQRAHAAAHATDGEQQV